jgi:hypothetical protein
MPLQRLIPPERVPQQGALSIGLDISNSSENRILMALALQILSLQQSRASAAARLFLGRFTLTLLHTVSAA